MPEVHHLPAPSPQRQRQWMAQGHGVRIDMHAVVVGAGKSSGGSVGGWTAPLLDLVFDTLSRHGVVVLDGFTASYYSSQKGERKDSNNNKPPDGNSRRETAATAARSAAFAAEAARVAAAAATVAARAVKAARAAAAAAAAAAAPSTATDASPLPDARQHVARGMGRFRRGEVAGSLIDFNAAIDRSPPVYYELWQRGLSLYYAGEFAEAMQQVGI